jgi:hypothetical protein
VASHDRGDARVARRLGADLDIERAAPGSARSAKAVSSAAAIATDTSGSPARASRKERLSARSSSTIASINSSFERK